jgi:hypothetical protein
MFKPCPNCGFLVALIKGREASQRCPRCGSALLEDVELPPADEAPREAQARHPEALPDATYEPSPRRMTRSAVDTGDRSAPVAPTEGNADIASPSVIADAGDVARGQPDDRAPDADGAAPLQGHAAPSTGESQAPSFASRRASLVRRDRRWPWAVALPLLALLLGLQLLLSQRAELAQDARWRPVLLTLCGVLGCDVPAWREPHAFAMLARDVRPHPTRDGVLHVTTSLRNDAPWPQPLPVVMLSLSDVDGRVLAARAVAPADYGRRPSALVEPGDSVDIAFDVREPSPRVVSFDFQLR